ncbi:unnamed protein product [Rotaria magnacalcarata]|uniref:Major facilitator superfamily (MFS) profile domain-containing protein n=1 Tax=Rotaria magnacalcarata TaxID=392030 RepID=A0A816RQF8_9BILA|nr:unnamed protein product [Rotaria magnacalcarata]CAF2093525.1 unnamed protein product [Rotaria magnacalcarata]CAF3784393.1 unnamed protein product [Rotaria magnacalcarata]CAF3863583.1 unnamed protein product [Rotaria magnacalcarata]
MSLNLIRRLCTWSSKQIFIVFAAFLVYVLADGTTFSFGLYVDALINEYSQTQKNTAFTVSTIAAFTQSIPLLLSPLVCWGTMKFGASKTSLIGCILSASGYCLPYVFQYYKTFWISAFGYGCLLSVGLAFCYVPAYLTLPFYFEDDRGLATGLAVSGSGFGQVVLAVIIKLCIIEYEWRGASLITGGLFLFMLISVVAFRKPASVLPLESRELIEFSNIPSVTPIVNEERSRDEETLPEHTQSRRSRGATFAQILPLFIASVPVHTSVTIPCIESRTLRRHSFYLRTHSPTITGETFPVLAVPKKHIPRPRANTIAVPLQTTRQLDGSFEQIRQPLGPFSLASITAADENSEGDEKPSSSLFCSSPDPPLPPPRLQPSESLPPEQIEIVDESLKEQHWLINSRFLLFCLSNFTLCLVMGVPYVIFPTYISETFLDQGYFASWTLSNVGVASALGQILLGYLHDREICSAWLMYTCAVIVSGTSLVILALFRYKIVVLICAFMFGLAISANYALQVLIVIDALSINNMANAFGILQFCQGVSTLIGIPIQGLLRDVSHTYKLSFLTSGFIIILSGMAMFFWPCLKGTNTKKINDVDDEK